jgi:hypothetical protein
MLRRKLFYLPPHCELPEKPSIAVLLDFLQQDRIPPLFLRRSAPPVDAVVSASHGCPG